MILSMSVLAHPSRTRWNSYLREKLGDIPFSMDDGCGLIENGKKAWKMYDPTAKFHCVFNDDAVIGKDFYNKASAILEKNGDKFAYSFYMGVKKGYKEIVDSAYNAKRGFIISKKLFFGVAICLPVKYIPHMFTFIDRIKDLPPNKNFDTRIHRYVRSVGLRVYYPIPSLVDHRSNSENESLVYDRGSDRTAQYFIGEGDEMGNPYKPAETTLPAGNPADKNLCIGKSIIFVDVAGVEHDALITYNHKNGEWLKDCLLNLLYVTADTDPQVQYMSMVPHRQHQPMKGMCWKERAR